MKLTDKQLLFVENYLLTLNATESYMLAYPTCKYETAMVNGSRLLTNPIVIEKLQEKRNETAERNNISKDNILAVPLSIMNDSNAKNLERLKAVEILLKALGYNEPDKVINNISTNTNLKELFEFDED